ncbi:MAG: thiamine phosphate synthase [Kiritimatiellae bacterium]|nr:thiamine phosphate synthase [Kiritimatiellia bacterium]MDW8459286.1 thiamine phosphate synthase [Verrucomicrobiota bacterium]
MKAVPMEPFWLYPIVDHPDWIPKLAACGLDLVQIRIKGISEEERRRRLEAAVRIADERRVRLIINDDWAFALESGAYGVHLGQDDLDGAPLEEIFGAGLRLGISTHNEAELARAEACEPSYIAIGTVFESPSKSFTHRPIGIEGFRKLRSLTRRPVVAIGGITAERAPALRAAGADGCAVISDLLRAADLSERVAQWRKAWFETPRESTSTI